MKVRQQHITKKKIINKESFKDYVVLNISNNSDIFVNNLENSEIKDAENFKYKEYNIKLLNNKHAYLISLLSLFILLFFAKPYL